MLSMTGFGSYSLQLEESGKSILIEIQSLNKKYLEISFFAMPDELFSLAIEIKKLISKKINRGLINVKISIFEIFPPKIEILKELKNKYDALADELEFQKNNREITFEFLLERTKKIALSKEDNKKILQGISLAIDDLIKMKKKEAIPLVVDIHKRIDNIKKMVASIEKRVPEIIFEYRKKISDIVKTFLQNKEASSLLKEMAFLVDKMCVTEELVRLQSHLSQIKSFKDGKRIEFLLQEILREVNTISSKILDFKITKNIVDIKSELDKIKEQIQNLE